MRPKRPAPKKLRRFRTEVFVASHPDPLVKRNPHVGEDVRDIGAVLQARALWLLHLRQLETLFKYALRYPTYYS